MLLNNFTATLYNNLKVTATNGVIVDDISFFEVDIASHPANYYNEIDTEDFNTSNFSPFRRGIAFGSGTTPPKKTDYKLNNYITTGLAYNNNSTSINNNVVSWVQTVQNTSTEQITITEVGLFCTYTVDDLTILLTRTVLDNPVILQPNEVKTFTITIDYNKFVDGTIIQNI